MNATVKLAATANESLAAGDKKARKEADARKAQNPKGCIAARGGHDTQDD